MFSAAATIALVGMCLTVANSQWVNEFDQSAKFECSERQSLSHIRSIHSNYFEDRRWQFRCRASYQISSCFWSSPRNRWGMPLAFYCPADDFINGISSMHLNQYEDRRFSFKCCQVKNKKLSSCYQTGFVNDWDGELKVEATRGFIFKGAYSVYDTYRKDRRWKFTFCRLW